MEPAAGWPSPARHLVRVVLPAPLRPTRPMRSPLATRKEADSMRTRAPARSSTPVAVITEILQCGMDGGRGAVRRASAPLIREEICHGVKSNGGAQLLSGAVSGLTRAVV